MSAGRIEPPAGRPARTSQVELPRQGHLRAFEAAAPRHGQRQLEVLPVIALELNAHEMVGHKGPRDAPSVAVRLQAVGLGDQRAAHRHGVAGVVGLAVRIAVVAFALHWVSSVIHIVQLVSPREFEAPRLDVVRGSHQVPLIHQVVHFNVRLHEVHAGALHLDRRGGVQIMVCFELGRAVVAEVHPHCRVPARADVDLSRGHHAGLARLQVEARVEGPALFRVVYFEQGRAVTVNVRFHEGVRVDLNRAHQGGLDLLRILEVDCRLSDAPAKVEESEGRLRHTARRQRCSQGQVL
mmetsp:Transcript_892/g.1689  ORF Transcript_892/g.1689 Transcript_892/m.1689 type:complete len:295 (-) Transcript_892:353-1237(-)